MYYICFYQGEKLERDRIHDRYVRYVYASFSRQKYHHMLLAIHTRNKNMLAGLSKFKVLTIKVYPPTWERFLRQLGSVLGSVYGLGGQYFILHHFNSCMIHHGDFSILLSTFKLALLSSFLSETFKRISYHKRG